MAMGSAEAALEYMLANNTDGQYDLVVGDYLDGRTDLTILTFDGAALPLLESRRAELVAVQDDSSEDVSHHIERIDEEIANVKKLISMPVIVVRPKEAA